MPWAKLGSRFGPGPLQVRRPKVTDPHLKRTSMASASESSLINVLNTCDNFHPHLSTEHLVPFLLSWNTRPALGLLRPSVVAALQADNVWRATHGHPVAWEIPKTDAYSSSNDGDSSPPYIAFAQTLVRGTPAARTLALAETLERWRAAANGVGCDDESSSGSAFAGVIGGSRWRAEWYDVYASPGGALRTDGRDPRTVLEAPLGASGYVFSMERSACALFGVVTYGVHMTVYEQDDEGEGRQVRVWVPRRALTKPTCVFCPCIAPLIHPPHTSCEASPACSTTQSRAAFLGGRLRSTRSSKRLRKRRALTPNSRASVYALLGL